MDIPPIVLSIVQDHARGFRIGIDRYLNKPIDTNTLFNEIGSLLDQGKSKKKSIDRDEDSGYDSYTYWGTQSQRICSHGIGWKGTNPKALANQPDIVIINSVLSANQDMVKSLFWKGMENVLFLVYQWPMPILFRLVNESVVLQKNFP